MATVIGGYPDDSESKGAGLKEVTVTSDADEKKTYLDVKVKDDGEITDEELDDVQMTQMELLNEILKEIKITNMHLAILSDNQIDKEEI